MKILRHRRYQDRYELVIWIDESRVGADDAPAADSLLALEWPGEPTIDPLTGEPSMSREEWEEMQIREAKSLAAVKLADLAGTEGRAEGVPLSSEGQQL